MGLCICLAVFAPAATAADKPRLVVDAGGHTANIRSLVFTRDGKYLVSAGLDKAIRIWDLATGQTVRTIRGWIGVGQEGNIYQLALSPDDRYLAVSGYMGRPTRHSRGREGPVEDSYENVNAVRIFDFQTGELLDTLHGNEGTINQLTFTADKNYLLAGDAYGDICVWLIAPEQMKRVRTFGGHKRRIEQIAVRNGDTTVASLSFDGNMKIWDAVTGLLIRGMGRQKHLAASPDGRYLISVSEDNRVLIWNFKDGQFVRELTRYDGDIRSISYIANGNKLLVDTDRETKVLAADSGEVITTLKHNAEQITTTAISRDGSLVASGLSESDDISIWNSENGEVKRLGGVGMPFYAVGFSNDGHAIAFGRESVWNGVNNRGPLQSAFRFAQGDSYQIGFESRINKSDFSRSRDATGELALRPKEAPYNALEILKNGRISGEIKTGNPFTCYTLTADGRYIIAGTYDGHLEVYKTESPKLAFFFGRKDQDLVGHEGPVWAVAASPDNRTVVSGSADHTLRLWDIETGTNILTMFVGPDGEWVAWTPEGYYTSSLNGDKYLGWHASRGVTKTADYYPAAQFQKQYYRPGIVAQYLKSRDIKLAIQQESVSAGKPLPPQEAEITSGPVIDVTTIVPPVVVFTSPEEGESVADDEFTIVRAVAKAADNTLPVTGIKLFLNGTEVRSKKDNQQELSIEARVQLQSGSNVISVVAQNQSSTSQPVTRTIRYTGKNPKSALPNLRILAIGISNYKNPAFTLKFADKDAMDFEAVFKAQEKLHLLIDKVYSKTILNEQATRAAIIEGLDWLTDSPEVRPGDFILLFLSGHGGLDRDNYYFYTYNHDPSANPEKDDIRWNILMDGLTRVSGTKPILFVDTCRAGAANGEFRTKGDQGFTQALKDLKHNYQGVVFFAASSSEQKSLEMDSVQHGAFTYELLEGLKGKADLSPPDNMIYINELGNWIRGQVRIVSKGFQDAIYDEPLGFRPFPLLALPKQ